MVAWLVTLPAAGAVGAASYGFTRIFGTGASGPLIAFSLAILLGLILAIEVFVQAGGENTADALFGGVEALGALILLVGVIGSLVAS